MFIKCSTSHGTLNELEGSAFRCPKGYTYWRVSRRCEKRSKIPMCRDVTTAEDSANLPVEWINLGKGRSLRLF